MKKTLKKNNDRGFSLLELLVAITVLAIGLLGIAGLQGTTIRRNVSAMRNTEATALIEDKIEEYRNIPYSSISEGLEEETGLGTEGVFTRITNIQNNIPVPGSTKTITVQVSWSDPNPHTFSFQTVVSN